MAYGSAGPPRTSGAWFEEWSPRVESKYGGGISGQLKSIAAFNACSTAPKTEAGNAPARFDNFERSIVVIWWHSATLGFAKGSPVGSSTTVGPRAACRADVDTGTTMIDRQPAVWLKASCETTMTGRCPACSDPERGRRSAQ